VIAEWKRRYLDLYDARWVEEVAGDDFPAQRRKVVQATFNKLQRLSRDMYGDYTDDELPKQGAVLLCPLKDGRLGACRILRCSTLGDDPYYAESMMLVAVSCWVGSKPPALDDPELRKILRPNHHNHKGELELGWLSKPPPRSFKYLGDIAPSKRELKLGPPTFYRDWTVLPEQILLQWRWDNDRRALLAEEAKKK
jgi:hypothetical protein